MRALVVGTSIALVAWLALVPLGFLLWQSVHAPAGGAEATQLTVEHYRAAYSSRETARLLGNSLQFAAGAALVAFTLGTLLAFVNERTDTPFKRLFFALSLVPLVIPACCSSSHGCFSAARGSASSTSRCGRCSAPTASS